MNRVAAIGFALSFLVVATSGRPACRGPECPTSTPDEDEIGLIQKRLDVHSPLGDVQSKDPDESLEATTKYINGVPIYNYHLAHPDSGMHPYLLQFAESKSWVIIFPEDYPDAKILDFCNGPRGQSECGYEGHPSEGGVAFAEFTGTEAELKEVLKGENEMLHAITYSIGGPPRLLQPGADPFDESVRAMGEFDKNITPACSMKYGKSMLETLRTTTHIVCDGLRSKIVCHERAPFDIPRYMCELHHIQVSSTSSRAEVCEIRSLEFGVSELHFFKKLQSQETPLECSSSVNGNALIQVPWDTRNFYEWYGDWVTMWESLAALEWNPKDTKLFLVLDESSEAMQSEHLIEAWSLAFGGRLHMGSSEELFGNGTCFDNAVIVPHGGLSTATFNGGRAGSIKCASPTLMASALYLEALFNPSPALFNPSPDILPSSKHVTLLLRRGNRAFENDTAAEESVRQVLPLGWSFLTYRPEDMSSLREQLAVAAQTNVLIGVHGAGLTHLLFLPPKARIVEIFCGDRKGENRHYANLETMANEPAMQSRRDSHLEVRATSCKVDSNVVRHAIEDYEMSNGGIT